MKQLRVSGEVKMLEAAITCSQLLMIIDPQLVSAVKKVSKKHSKLKKLTEKVALLTEQVASLSTQQSSEGGQGISSVTKLAMCNVIVGFKLTLKVSLSSKLIVLHIGRNCWYQRNEQGMSTQGNRFPPITYSANVVTVTVAVVRSQATTVQGELGRKAVDFFCVTSGEWYPNSKERCSQCSVCQIIAACYSLWGPDAYSQAHENLCLAG